MPLPDPPDPSADASIRGRAGADISGRAGADISGRAGAPVESGFPSERASLIQALTALDDAFRAGGALVRVYGTVGSLGPALAAHLHGGAGRDGAPVLYVVADDDDADARVGDLQFFLGAAHHARGEDPLTAPDVLALPAAEGSPYAEVQPDRRTIMRRMAALFRLSQSGNPDGRALAPAVLVASAPALLRRVVPRSTFSALSHTVKAGSSTTREALVEALERAGYGRAPLVEDPGTFAVRGSVVDVYPPIYKHPVRIELFGDEVESIRLYDASTQRTLRNLDVLHAHPVRETVRSPGADPRARILEAADAAAYPSSKTRLLLDHIEDGSEFFGIEALAPVFHQRMESVLDYLPSGAKVVLEDPEAIMDQARRTEAKLRESAGRRRAEHRLALDPREFVLQEDEIREALAAHSRMELRPVEIHGNDEAAASLVLRVSVDPNTTLRAELAQARSADDQEGSDLGKALRTKLNAWMGQGQRIRLVAPNRSHAERLSGLLTALGLAAPFLPSTDTGLRGLLQIPAGAPALAVVAGTLTRGFRSTADRIAIVSEEEIFGARAHREARPSRTPGIGDLGEIAENDLVVHDEHGVGRYRGLKKLDVRGVTQDFVHLEYDGGSVYVPVYRIGLVHRYVGGGEDETARLDKLGGKTWQDKKRRVSAEARKVAEELLQLYAQRKALPGHPMPPPDVVFREFEETFAFDETPDQAKAIEAVLGDMQRASPMDRLICGDVGYGKTEIALRAALLAVLGGKQVAVLAPTTVLAEQHFVTFSERLRDFPVRVGSLSRFRTRPEQLRTIAALTEGKLDIVIGTHRLLSRDVRFNDLGLIVIDEEQRFGVTHKERLKELRTQVDVLTLTATPIPRTLQMAMAGMREISIIATPPVDRLAIRTFVCTWDEELLREALDRELARGGQVFFVHNRVEDMASWAERIQALAPKARVAIGHGQMAEGELEKVMIDFVDGRYDVLCCTTIIESGLDISRANTMIVNRADMFGLAQLYQIRGRIGRSKERAYCYLVVPGEAAITADAKQRLAVLQRFTELGAGFQVSTFDLEIRGAGELLGEKQSGSVAAVGFDTYARILEEAVAELRGQPIRREFDPEIAVDVPAFIPDDYVPDTGQRLDYYRRLAQATDEDDVRAVLADLEDRCGPVPEEVALLAEVMVDKGLVRRIGALGYELGPARMVLALGTQARLEPAKVLALVQRKGSRWKLAPDMRLSYAFDDAEKQDHLGAARRRLLEVEACVA